MIQESIQLLIQRQDLTEVQMKESMKEIMEGSATHSQIASFLTALRMKGETIEEVSSAAHVMREKAQSVFDKETNRETNREIFDVVGTGGDGVGSFNVSTATALLLASGGVSVAKHGNRGVSSNCGSADVLQALGVNLSANRKVLSGSIREVGFGFLFAPLMHPAMKHAMVPRRELGIRTVFNLLGPLTNPLSPRLSLIGVYDRQWVEPIAYVLRNLGWRRAMVVHGEDGLDEITTTTRTWISELKDGKVSSYSIDPKDYGIPYSSLESLKGGSPNENAQIILNLLEGKGKETEKEIKTVFSKSTISAKRDILVLNAGACFYIAGISNSIDEGIQKASELLDSQEGIKTLNRVIEFSNQKT